MIFELGLFYRTCKKTLIGVEAESQDEISGESENCSYCTVRCQSFLLFRKWIDQKSLNIFRQLFQLVLDS